MSLITRCTACQTLFKVVPDQLRISDGWVRCGQCGEIFDAAQNLLVDQDEPLATADAADVDSEKSPAPAPEDMAAELAGGQTAHTSEAPVDSPPPLAPETDTPIQPVATPPSQTEPAATPDMPSFMQGTVAPSRWQRRGARRALAVAAGLLTVTLVAQVLRHERDRLATIEPALRPVLSTLCQWSGCSLSPMRQIESVVIDSSSFSRLRGDVYRLAFSLHNAAPADIAMPSLELSVTDTRDQALARRVILPAEFGATALVLGAGAEWGGRISLNVKSGSTERVAGYRLVAFYP